MLQRELLRVCLAALVIIRRGLAGKHAMRVRLGRLFPGSRPPLAPPAPPGLFPRPMPPSVCSAQPDRFLWLEMLSAQFVLLGRLPALLEVQRAFCVVLERLAMLQGLQSVHTATLGNIPMLRGLQPVSRVWRDRIRTCKVLLPVKNAPQGIIQALHLLRVCLALLGCTLALGPLPAPRAAWAPLPVET